MAHEEGAVFVLIAADLGGTNFRFEARVLGERIMAQRYEQVQRYGSLEGLMKEVLPELHATPSVTCIAVAGRVHRSGRSALVTNLGWELNAADLERLGLGTVVFINDFEAVALALDCLARQDITPLNGKWTSDGDAVVVGPGTGLGVAFRFRTPFGLVARATESGHQEWPARTEFEWSLRRHIAASRARTGSERGDNGGNDRVSFEDVVSGPGLVNLYRAVSRSRHEGSGSPIADIIAGGASDAPAIIAKRASQGDPICAAAVRVFWEALAVLASDLALHDVPGGVYIVGNIARQNRHSLLASEFLTVFRDKAPHQGMLADTPVFLVNTEKELGVEGAAIKATTVTGAIKDSCQ